MNGTNTTKLLRESLAADFPAYEVDVLLSENGERAVDVAGPAWVTAAVRPLLLAHPRTMVDLDLELAYSEPMTSPPDPVWAGDPWQRDRAAGKVRLTPRGEEAGSIRRVCYIADADTWEGRGSYTGPALEGSRSRRIALSAYGKIESRVPLILDVTRQQKNTSAARSLDALAPQYPRPAVSVGGDAAGTSTCWVAMHWLEAGGAESWAFEQARLAKDAGYHVVITADRSAPQRQIARALEITSDVHLMGNALWEGDLAQYMVELTRAHKIDLVLIHHSAMAYRWLPEIRLANPDSVVIDSTHILEHRTGGFVRQSILRSHQIDLHHVISPELRDRYTLGAGIDPAKVVYRPLTGTHNLAAQEARTPHIRSGNVLRLGFLGRFVQQKRPYVFLELGKRLVRRSDDYRFVMQGSGVQEKLVAKRVKSFGLAGVLERRSWGPVDKFFQDIDILIVTSDNEGLTLTTLEADSAGVLVVSADVGSQRTVIARGALLPREPMEFLRIGTSLLEALREDDSRRLTLLAEQHRLVEDLRRHDSATAYFTRFFADTRKAHS